jgi:hypothetical protein
MYLFPCASSLNFVCFLYFFSFYIIAYLLSFLTVFFWFYFSTYQFQVFTFFSFIPVLLQQNLQFNFPCVSDWRILFSLWYGLHDRFRNANLMMREQKIQHIFARVCFLASSAGFLTDGMFMARKISLWRCYQNSIFFLLVSCAVL